MSLNRNIAANYASQTYVVGVGIAVTPLYLAHMGAEPYGLIGFFAVMQSWFGLLDLGLTPTIARETSRYHGGALSSQNYRQLFRALSVIFLFLAIIAGSAIWLASDRIATDWLRFGTLGRYEVVQAVQLIGCCVALRWLSGLYRGVVGGAEQLVWLSGFNVLVATLRFVAVFASMQAFGYTPRVFFLHQLGVAVFEVGGLLWRTHGLMPRPSQLTGPIGWSVAPVLPLLRFSLKIAFTSVLWIAVTQSDRLILSGILSLKDYGYFSLAVMVAGGITMITSATSVAITPRLARLHVESKETEFIAVYRRATRLVTLIAGTAAVTLAVCAEPALRAWTGDPEVARSAAPVMQLYALGNGLLALASFPFYIQYARGQLFYHIVGHALLAVLLLPAVIYAATHYGGRGAGWVWVITNVVYVGGWVAFVHGRLVPGLHLAWLRDDIARIAVPLAVVGGMIAWLVPSTATGQMDSLNYCMLTAAALATTAASMFLLQGSRRMHSTPIDARIP